MSTALPPRLRDWRRQGSALKVYRHRVHVWTLGDPGAEPLVLLHGFPTSSYDFHAVVEALAQRFYVIFHDHLGFGLSDKPEDYSYSLLEQAEVAMEVWRQLGLKRAHLLAHDYGTSIATELLARRERGLLAMDILSVTLCNGSVHLDLARPLWTQHLLRSGALGPMVALLSTSGFFKARIRSTLAHPESLPETELNLMWESILYKGGKARMPQLASYLDERQRFRERWIGPLTRLNVPAHILWGRRDPIALPAVARQLASEIPDARLTWLEELGHYPMLEDPERWSQGALSFFS